MALLTEGGSGSALASINIALLTEGRGSVGLGFYKHCPPDEACAQTLDNAPEAILASFRNFHALRDTQVPAKYVSAKGRQEG